MKKFKKLMLLSSFICFLGINHAFCEDYRYGAIPLKGSSNVIKADVKSERIPAGTILAVRMETPANSHNYFEGDAFRANLLEDIRIGSMVVLPAGTMLRGSVDKAQPGRRFSRAGHLSLKFDHAVTPFGKQIPLAAKITSAKNLNEDGVFYAGGSYFKSMGKAVDTSANILTTTTTYCVDKGMSFWKGFPVIVTAPAGVFAGSIGGGGYFVYKSVYYMVKKGNDVKVNPGDIFQVTLIEPLDVPIN
ncbi:MAG TPA: hypothetical protein P5556_10630 [Candidatus Gastranaerophilales bacterium]|nr:hypothetical protein [Candidatus Gastranaerophilales bacterium]